MTPLLLLVDLQRDYLDSPGLEPADGIVVERAADLLASCRAAGVPVAHAWTTVSRAEDRRMAHWKREGRWLCEEGTAGHSPPAGLEAAEGEPVVHKAAYSAFEDGALEHLLADTEVDLLIVAGVHLHACVRQTVLDAYRLADTEIWVAEEATASDDPVHAAITRRYLERRSTRFLSNAEIRAALANGGPGGAGGAGGATDAAAAAVRECRAALPAWRRADPAARAEVLESLAGALRAEAPGLSEQMAVEIGKPVAYGTVEIERTAEMLEAVARRTLESAQARNGDAAEVRRRPLGVVAAITPWNNPVYIALGKIAPALAFGNAVAWKPGPAASSIAERVAGLLSDAGLPDGALSLLPGGRAEGAALMAAEGVDAVTVTGSSATGFAAQDVCSRRRIPLQAELGGNNAALVSDDADLELAAREIAEGAFAQAGQRCTANRRVVVHGGVRSRLLELLAKETAALVWGDPREDSTQVGPLISSDARDRVAAAVARAGGTATVPTAPEVPGYEGRWYPPTILSCDDASEEIVHEETFGPVLVVQEAEGWNDAVELVNGVRQGLAAALFSTSPEMWERFLEEAEAGILKLNRSTADAEVDVPFGGWKESGIGPPEHGSFDRDFYTRPQAVYR